MNSNPEELKTGGEKSAEEIENGPWGKEYQESVPPFNPEQKQEMQAVDDSELVQKMINQSDSDQEDLEWYIEDIKKQGGDLNNAQEEDLKKIYDWESRCRDEGESLTESIEKEIARQQELERILTDALREQGTGNESRGKPIEEILQVKIDNVIEQMKKLDDEIERAGGKTEVMDGQYEELKAEKAHLDETLIWTENFRKAQEMKKEREQVGNYEAQRTETEKYGPEIYSERIITDDKLEEYERDKAAYIARLQIPHKAADGTFEVYAPDEEKIKEYDELIESEKRKIGEEEGVWRELHFEDGETHANDAVNELDQFVNSLTTQIDDAEKSGAVTSEKTVRELKRKQAAARRLARKIQEYNSKV